MHSRIKELYICNCSKCNSESNSEKLALADELKKPFKQLFNDVLTAMKTLHTLGSYSLKDLFETKEYKRVINKTFAILKQPIKDNVISKAMQSALDKDVFVFSALKTHAQLFEASRLLQDEEGKIKPFYKFKEDFKAIVDDFNSAYLEAEYHFAVSSSIVSGQWAELADDAILQYRTMNDNKVREDHRLLNRTTLPKTAKFWEEYYPPNGWNCRCVAIEVREGKYELTDEAYALKEGKAATTQYDKNGNNRLEIFRFNPGISQVVFPPNHPYRKVQGAKDIIKEVNNGK